MRQRLVRLLVRVPGIRGLYLKALVKTLDRTPRSKLPPELQAVQRALKQLPTRQQKLAALEAEFAAQSEPPPQSRALRRAAAKQQRRR